jgi:hypothetical protein
MREAKSREVRSKKTEDRSQKRRYAIGSMISRRGVTQLLVNQLVIKKIGGFGEKFSKKYKILLKKL